MADLRDMFAKLSNGSSNGPSKQGESPPKPAGKKKPQTIEETYQKKSQLEHILLRPDTYIGSVEKVAESMWVYDMEAEMMVQKNIEYVPGLYKIFDEILVNAADNKQRDKNMDLIRININQEANEISIYNNGEGIPVTMHSEEKMFVPSMIFGHLLTSSNFNDEEAKVTGGRNGYGAKLCNIFSLKFVVETASKRFKKKFKQTWIDNMSQTNEPKIASHTGEDYTKITFIPDLKKFKMDKLDDDIVSLMTRRAYDIAASARGVKVFLNDKKLPIKNFKDYVDLFIKGKEGDGGNPLKVVYEQPSERWEVAFTISDRGFQQMSFVNSIATTKGGRHVDYVADMIVKQTQEVLKKKNKGGVSIKPFQIKSHMWIFINCLIVNPTFDSQTKESLTLQAKNFGSKCTLSEKFINAVQKSGLVETVLSWAKFKEQTDLVKASGGKKQRTLKGIPKLEDANEAGGAKGFKCTLILTEGDSAKSLAVSGLGVIGRDYYGVFPLRGKLLNVREATYKQIMENAEIENLVKIVGLQYKKKYKAEDIKALRYGKIMIMTDQDQDGSHIKGLLINFIHFNWPELLRLEFLEEFITPIVKARKRNQELSFYSLPEFEEWKRDTPSHKSYKIKYYKGLGTSTSKEAKEYFSNMERHRITFKYNGQEDDDHIVMAFSKKHIEARKEWLTRFMQDSRERKELGLPDRYLYTKNTKSVSYKDFINLELVLFSNADNIRSIPSLVDGFKPGQRKVLFTCVKRNDKNEVKVAQLAGSVAEHSAYHHGEVSLCATIVNLAQNFVGSNNINILEPRGQFGTRLAGGKDSASARYIFTKMSPLTRLIFHPHDDPLLAHEYDDNQKIEPVYYVPIIPMVLVNGADGIGTGWMTKIPNYNPRELAKCIRNLLDDDELTDVHPWYKNFKGTIEFCGENRYCVSGEISVVGQKLEITELPVGTWTQNYKENVLEPMRAGTDKVKNLIQDYKEYNTDTTVRFVVVPKPGELQNMEKDGLHKVLKLQSLVSISSMCCFDEFGSLRRYDSVMDIINEYFKIRLKFYHQRKSYLQGMLEAEAKKLTNQARFIVEKCSGKITVENKKRKVIVQDLKKACYDPDPVKVWKKSVEKETDEEEQENQQQEEEVENLSDEEEEEEDMPSKAKKPRLDAEQDDMTDWDYLLGMSFWMLTDEKKNELLRQRDTKLAQLDQLRKKTPSDLWRDDLDVFLTKLDEVEAKERRDEGAVVVKKGKKKATKYVDDDNMFSNAVRVVPTITEDLKKKIQAAVKTKENKGKRTQKREAAAVAAIAEEEDDIDALVREAANTSVAAKSSDSEPKSPILKKPKGRKKAEPVVKSPKAAKKGKKRTISDSDESDDNFNVSLDEDSGREVATRPGRARKNFKYTFDDSDSDF